MGELVSMKDWKRTHPDRIIVSLLYDRTVLNITSEDYRTTYKSHVQKYAHTQVQFDAIIDDFLTEHPTAKIVNVIDHSQKEA